MSDIRVDAFATAAAGLSVGVIARLALAASMPAATVLGAVASVLTWACASKTRAIGRS